LSGAGSTHLSKVGENHRCHGDIRSRTTGGNPILDDLVTTGDGAPWEQGLRRRLSSGEAAVLFEIYDRNAALVYGQALSRTQSPQRAYAISLQVFLHLWLHPDTLSDSRVPLRLRLLVLVDRLALGRVLANG
jgi:hypothetical protein